MVQAAFPGPDVAWFDPRTGKPTTDGWAALNQLLKRTGGPDDLIEGNAQEIAGSLASLEARVSAIEVEIEDRPVDTGDGGPDPFALDQDREAGASLDERERDGPEGDSDASALLGLSDEIGQEREFEGDEIAQVQRIDDVSLSPDFLGQLLSLGDLAFLNIISTAYIQDEAVTYAKIQDVAASSLLGSAAGGTVEEIPFSTFDLAGTAASEVADHVAEVDPHTQYLTATEGDAAYQAIGDAPASFTPGLTFGGAAVGITYGGQPAKAARVNKICTFALRVVLTSKGSSTGNALITNLPYAADTTAVIIPVTVVPNGNFAAGVTGSVVGAINGGGAGSQVIALYLVGASGVLTQLTDAHFTNTSDLFISGSYLTT